MSFYAQEALKREPGVNLMGEAPVATKDILSTAKGKLDKNAETNVEEKPAPNSGRSAGQTGERGAKPQVSTAQKESSKQASVAASKPEVNQANLHR
jgi:hypothetical protein